MPSKNRYGKCSRKDGIMDAKNIYMPFMAEIEEVKRLTHNTNLYTINIELLNLSSQISEWKPGQFFMVSVFGYGEVAISVTSLPEEHLKFCIKKVGFVTSAIHSLKAGDKLGIRGPYGRGFPMEVAKGRDVIIMAGGLGIAPLRALIHEILKNRERHKDVFLLYGSKTPSDILYKDELSSWAGHISVHLTVDSKDEVWKGKVGVVTELLREIDTDFQNSSAYICGPPVMIEAGMKALTNRGMPSERLITTLEAHMKCGVGKCGHCYMGAKYICTDGPVFTGAELKDIKPSSP